MGRRTALLIATSMYGDPGLRRLRAPAGEAEELQQVLLSQGAFDQVEVLRNESKRQIERGIEEAFQEAGPDDLVLLYLSCHGIKNDHGQLLFAACNTELDRIESSAVGSVFVQHQLSASQAGTKVVLLDCCYSGAFSHGLVPKSAEGIDLRQLVGRGTYIMTATSAVEYAYEGDELTSSDPVPSSLFTRAVLKGIRTGAADIDGDGLITGDELYNYVFRELEGQRQTPSRETRMAGDFFIARTASAPVAEFPLPFPAKSVPAALGPLLVKAIPTMPPAGSTLNVVVGTLGADAAQEPFMLSLAEPDSHLAVVGPTQSGKSQFLRTLLLSLAADSEPEEVEIIIIDSESRFGAFGKLPHVSWVLGPDESTKVRQLLDEIERSISARRATFRQHSFDSLSEFRAARRNRDLRADGPQQDVILVIDRWEAFAAENPALVRQAEKIADTGASFGVHVVVATRSWSRISGDMLPNLRGKVDLAASAGPDRPVEATTAAGTFQVAVPNSSTGAEPRHQEMVSMIEGIAQQKQHRHHDRKFNPERILGVGPPFDPPKAWRDANHPDWLRVPIGVDEFGRTVHLDLRSAAFGGVGPHGMIVGPPGSGAVQTLGSLLFLLMLAHSPADLNVVLLQASPISSPVVQGLSEMPHVVAHMAVSYAEKSELANRLRDIHREITRRRSPAWAGRGTTPRLVVAIQDFTEALVRVPELVPQLREVMELGPDVGVHVIVMASSIADTRFLEIAELCRFWIVHRTAAERDSLELLGIPAAAELDEDEPGQGFFKAEARPPIKFRAWAPGMRSWAELIARVNRAVPVRPAELRAPLAAPIALGDVLGTLVQGERGLSAVAFERATEVPIGLVDSPETGEAEPLVVPFGSIAIQGRPFSGKADLTRAVILAVALTHTPEEAQFYFIGAGGGYSCEAVLSELPHVVGVAAIGDGEIAAAVVDFLVDLLSERKARREGAHVRSFLVIEQWHQLADAFAELVPNVRTLLQDGSDHGIHVIISGDCEGDEDLGWGFQHQVRLELGGADSGRGTVNGREFRAALPQLDADDQLDPQYENTRALSRRIASAWPGESVQDQVLLASPRITYSQVEDRENPHILLGRAVGIGRMAELDLEEHPHLLCLGERGSGKTNLVRLVIAEIKRLHAADECDIIVLDPKRGLLGEADGPQFGYAAVRGEFERILAETAFRIEQRLSRPRSGAERPREVFLIIEDCGLISSDPRSGRPDPLQRYADHLVRGGEVGVHLIVSRNSVNIGDALTTRFLGKLRAAGCATVVLGGDPRDGELLPGVASVPRPPGRGRFVRGRRNDMIQVAEMPPSA
ncbi:FtsK/SpoIIIE family protein [Saccharopolyspora shandongensis]|uniref:FtsK/SpoIIIE family protein n=1 Tax=Saccharopolyspora shandongensis TaxID=418495 RepID=A0A1H2W4X1_9PSEU|nr:FtsK/SpoIIIE domain-containing protein [Saccharopolyspora shandongensis]SDW75608.1 FtsK/SpoIIIE family protein [Saccharopolyspora shandongensis]